LGAAQQESQGVKAGLVADLPAAQGAVQGAAQTAGQFEAQARALADASVLAESAAQKVAASSARLKRGAFLEQATFIVESLHSLSLDVTRLAEGGVDERAWRAFQRGDTAAFTRRLAQLEDALPLPRAQRKFAEDGEFRAYVQRFLHKFESLWDGAQEADHDALLATTFAGSDMGRLYHLLARVAGRTPRLPPLPDKAGAS